MTRRDTLLTEIMVEFATHGKETAYALRIYTENRMIGRAAYLNAAARGFRHYQLSNAKKETHP